MELFSLYFMLFLIYSFAGWCIEVVNSLIVEKKFVNRGFMLGPYCPIYGYSSILMIFYLDRYTDNILTVFLLAVVVCSFAEYMVSYAMEKLFNARWWDYSDRSFNINGRVCLTNAFLFGILGVLLVYIINPFIKELLLEIKPIFLIIIAVVWFIIFTGDFIISMNVTYRIKNTIKKLQKDNTEEFSNKVREVINKKLLNRRLVKAFPDFRKSLEKFKVILEDKFDKEK